MEQYRVCLAASVPARPRGAGWCRGQDAGLRDEALVAGMLKQEGVFLQTADKMHVKCRNVGHIRAGYCIKESHMITA